MTLALLVFAATYLLMLRLQQYRPWVALCSAVLFIMPTVCARSSLSLMYVYLSWVTCSVAAVRQPVIVFLRAVPVVVPSRLSCRDSAM